MPIKKTIIKACLTVLDAETLETKSFLSLGIIERPSQAEKIRLQLSDNNPDCLFLCTYNEVLNPEYSPLTMPA